MILQALVNHYDALAKKGRITETGWSNAKVSYGLELSEEGQLIGVISKKVQVEEGKKYLPAIIKVPEQIKKTSGVAANFMCENASYFLGYDYKGKPDKTRQCFEAAKLLHHQILDEVNSPAAQRVLKFFDSWDTSHADSNEFIIPLLTDIEKGAVFVFEDECGNMLHNDTSIVAAWEKYKECGSTNAVLGRCLVTGEEAPIAILHPSIKGIHGAQSSGASLVSFNAPASESYGNESGQGMNAPVGELAAFKYATALNFLISDFKHIQYIADTALIYWAEDAEPVYQDVFSAVFTGEDNLITDKDLEGILQQVSAGGAFEAEGHNCSYDNKFYILGIAPNAARLSVRLFLQGTFGNMMQNLMEHNNRLDIIQPIGGHKKLPIWQLLNETANQKSKNKMPPSPMAGAVLQSVIMNTRYPYSLYEMILIRIRAEHDINWRKAAIIKAIFMRNYQDNIKLMEVAQVSVSESDYEPYVLGRLFAVLEMIQKSANPGIKATIKDKYFTSAAATPAHVFPILIGLTQHHLKKLNDAPQIYYDKMLTELQNKITSNQYSPRLNLQEQGAFYLGYYHQKQALYTKKENNTEADDNE